MSLVKILTVSSLLVASAYAAGTGACKGCHGQQFEKKAMGTSKIVKDMSKEDIVAALKGYKDGSYGAAMKGIMKGQVASLSDADMAAMADEIKGGGEATKAGEAATSVVAAATTAPEPKKIVDINAKSSDAARISKEDLGTKKEISEEMLGLRKSTLNDESVKPAEGDFKRASAGSSDRFERAYVNAPPMIPHSVDGLLPITQNNNQCLGCHMPAAAKGVGATAIPKSHFTNYRPDTVYKDGELVKEGQIVGLKGGIGNTSDIKIAKAKTSDKLYQGRFNCSQCHAPQANIDTAVANTFQSDGLTDELKSGSNLVDKINEGVN